MNTILIKIHKPFGPYVKGQVKKVYADEHGNPIDPYFRKRLRDAQHDYCCEVIEKKQPAPSKKTGKKSKTLTSGE